MHLCRPGPLARPDGGMVFEIGRAPRQIPAWDLHGSPNHGRILIIKKKKTQFMAHATPPCAAPWAWKQSCVADASARRRKHPGGGLDHVRLCVRSVSDLDFEDEPGRFSLARLQPWLTLDRSRSVLRPTFHVDSKSKVLFSFFF